MYKVFFADDEASMRAGIRNNIDWDNSDFALVGEAPDGELALSLMQELMPDILITDVRMPFMDGIELSGRAKKSMPWLKIIILSGHDEFEYAKQAITIGVAEYLLKPVTSERLMEALGKVASVIDAEREESRSIEKLLDDTRHVQIERMLSGLLYKSIDVESALKTGEKLGISILSDFYLVIQIFLYAAVTDTPRDIRKACAGVFSVLNDWGNTIYCNQGWDRILCVLKGSDTDALEEEAYACSHAVKYEAEREGECTASVVIGSVVSSVEELPDSLAGIDAAKRFLEFSDRRQIVSAQDIRNVDLTPLTGAKRLPMPEKLRYAEESDVPKLLDEYFSGFDSTSLSSFMMMNYMFVDILMSASRMVEELGGDPKEVLARFSDISGILSSGSGPDKEVFSSILKTAIAFRDSATRSKYYEIITKAQEYIRNNYDSQGISLHSVANVVNMSPNHFSTVFSQETGETFINYLTQIRLEQAKIMLRTTKLRASEIGYAVGYNDTHYFSYVFKKNTGMTPKEFRK